MPAGYTLVFGILALSMYFIKKMLLFRAAREIKNFVPNGQSFEKINNDRDPNFAVENVQKLNSLYEVCLYSNMTTKSYY